MSGTRERIGLAVSQLLETTSMRAITDVLPPLLQRDLLGSSRQPWTFWLRFLTTLAAVVVLVFIALGRRNELGRDEGSLIFGPLVVTLLIVVSLTGLRSTAGCVNKERRDGTLGLLFLTDLSASTILTSKLISHSIQNVAALLATLPVLGICVLLGGVSGSMFLQGVLAVLAALALALTIGLYESCTHDDDHTAFGQGVRRLLLFNLLPLASPISLLLPVSHRHGGINLYFWASLLFICLLAGSHWSRANIKLKDNWRCAGQADPRPAPRQPHLPTVRQVSVTAKLCGPRDPAEWIISRYADFRQVSPRAIALAFCACHAFVAVPVGLKNFDPVFMAGLYLIVMGGARFVQLLAMAKIAPQSFADITANGALEILQTTPVTLRELVTAARFHLVREFRRGVVPMLALDLMLAFLICLHLPASPEESSMLLQILVVQELVFLTALPAIGFFGIWAGLRFGNFSRAVFWTTLLTIMLPLLTFFLGNYQTVGVLLALAYGGTAVCTYQKVQMLAENGEDLINALYH